MLFRTYGALFVFLLAFSPALRLLTEFLDGATLVAPTLWAFGCAAAGGLTREGRLQSSRGDGANRANRDDGCCIAPTALGLFFVGVFPPPCDS